MLTLSAPKPWFPSSLCHTQSPPSQVPATDGDKRYLLFEGVVLGFCVNPLFRISLVGCLLLWILRKLLASWWYEAWREGPRIFQLCNCANSKVLMKSETRMRTTYLQNRFHPCICAKPCRVTSLWNSAATYLADWHTSNQNDWRCLVQSSRVWGWKTNRFAAVACCWGAGVTGSNRSHVPVISCHSRL